MSRAFKTPLALALSGLLALSFSSCAPDDPAAYPEVDPDEHETADLQDPVQARYQSAEEVLAAMPQAQAAAAIRAVSEWPVDGYATFEEVEGGLRVHVDVTGLQPGLRAIHVHEHGSCAPGDDGAPAGAAGGHFAPLDSPHGAPDHPRGERHVGDFGNLDVGSDGSARLTFVDEVATLDGETSIVGKALVIHDGEDDLETQPTGDAGGRVACGIIQAR
jgi:superoxide dismutase, Cu-Zn family